MTSSGTTSTVIRYIAANPRLFTMLLVRMHEETDVSTHN